MAQSNIEPNETYVGLIVDGVEGTSYVPGALTLEPLRGPRLKVPYIAPVDPRLDPNPELHNEQFGHVHRWFQDDQIPPNLVLVFEGGNACLFGTDLRQAKHPVFGGGYAQGTIAVDAIVVSRKIPDDLSLPLALSSLISEIDHLFEWAGFTGFTKTFEHHEDSTLKAMSISTSDPQSFSWHAGDATLTIKSHWEGGSSRGYGVSAGLDASALFESSFKEPTGIEGHLQIQRKLLGLLVMAYGKPTAFLKHKTTDDQFDRGAQVIHFSTFREPKEPVPKQTTARSAYPSLWDIEGEVGLERWFNKSSGWDRAINPIIGLLQRDSHSVEDVIISAMISLETMGQLLPKVEDEENTYRPGKRPKPTSTTFAMRCIMLLGNQWEQVADSPAGLARAIANNYNDIKHFDRGRYPDLRETHALGRFALTVARLTALRQASTTGITEFLQRTPEVFERTCRAFDGRRINLEAEFYTPVTPTAADDEA
ncbi:ApeA N-terminal domain 1-containing protein [Arthrobacter pigmenti]